MPRSAVAAPAIAVAILATSAVRADDLTPPPWRFQPGTTFQHWDFSAGPGGGAPDAPGVNLFNPYGTPILTPGGGAGWLPSFGGRNDVWGLASAAGLGSLAFDVPNTNVSQHQKDLWLQITYFGTAPSWTVAGPTGVFGLTAGPITTPLANGWFHELTEWNVATCPPFERVSISPNTAGAVLFVDQVVIDTQCYPIPTPGGAALLGLAGLSLLRRRR